MGWGGVNPEHMCPDPHWPGQQGIQPVPPHIGPVISSADFLRAFLAPKPGSVPLPNHHHLPLCPGLGPLGLAGWLPPGLMTMQPRVPTCRGGPACLCLPYSSSPALRPTHQRWQEMCLCMGLPPKSGKLGAQHGASCSVPCALGSLSQHQCMGSIRVCHRDWL